MRLIDLLTFCLNKYFTIYYKYSLRMCIPNSRLFCPLFVNLMDIMINFHSAKGRRHILFKSTDLERKNNVIFSSSFITLIFVGIRKARMRMKKMSDT